ncbi:ABC transporter ATP-binding protein [Lacihabitans sp. LS3-19]|uniref:ABC transporter ATP-binding protein n=1 Tax=Lacihabitans sp. LS3-19 TaxID=2487335 RepID=UPI0020CE938A|nr:ABC transporter ATP-binding protein [Lacihabitans sp. LS3-19]MCP9770652.1 ABC transporter ATP-binding protein [Lacihabitans sp. LS3-19]
MIRFENIYKKFGKLEVLNDISIRFDIGQSIAIVGPNGSGKTTLIKILLGMVLPDKGKLFFEDKNIFQTHAYRGNIGYMPQISRYPPNLKIRQLIEMMTEIRKSEGWNGDIDEDLYEAFELDKIKNKPMGTLSGGTSQKVGAALAFRFNPKVLILDEPTAGLDPIAAEILKDKIQKERAKGKLVIITSHIVSDLEELTDYMLYMQETRVHFFKKIDDLKDQYGGEKLGKIIAFLMKKKAYNTLETILSKVKQ